MNSSQKLKAIVDNSGYKIKFIAQQIGLTYQGFLNRINDISMFRAHEITKICELLKIDDITRNEIFFTDRVEPQSTSSEYKG